MSSSRRTGTNEDGIDNPVGPTWLGRPNTFGDGARDYTSVGTWETDSQVDCVSLQKSPVLECYRDQASYAAEVAFEGSNQNTTYFRILRAASGHRHLGDPSAGVKFTATGKDVINLKERYTNIQDVVATGTYNEIGNEPTFGSTVILQYYVACIAVDSSNAGSGSVWGFVQGGATATVNCAAINIDDEGFRVATTGRWYNCSAVQCGIGFFRNASTPILINCIGASNTTNFDVNGGSWGSGTNFNSSSSGTATGGGDDRVDQTFSFKDTGNDDYHLKADDGGARNHGVDLSSDGYFDFDDDIDGESRPAESVWDIGFDEFVSSANWSLAGRWRVF
jgi:hypothetical protein